MGPLEPLKNLFKEEGVFNEQFTEAQLNRVANSGTVAAWLSLLYIHYEIAQTDNPTMNGFGYSLFIGLLLAQLHQLWDYYENKSSIKVTPDPENSSNKLSNMPDANSEQKESPGMKTRNSARALNEQSHKTLTVPTGIGKMTPLFGTLRAHR